MNRKRRAKFDHNFVIALHWLAQEMTELAIKKEKLFDEDLLQ